MLKLVGGTLVGSVNYSDLYNESDKEEDTFLTKTMTEKNNVKYHHCRK